jgi:uncharacterized membrane protein
VPKRDLIKETVKHSILFTRHVVPATIKPARTLWNEVIGFIFLIFAGAFGVAAMQAAMHFQGNPGEMIKLIFGGIVTVIMAFYGVVSFRKAKKISRS